MDKKTNEVLNQEGTYYVAPCTKGEKGRMEEWNQSNNGTNLMRKDRRKEERREWQKAPPARRVVDLFTKIVFLAIFCSSYTTDQRAGWHVMSCSGFAMCSVFHAAIVKQQNMFIS